MKIHLKRDSEYNIESCLYQDDRKHMANFCLLLDYADLRGLANLCLANFCLPPNYLEHNPNLHGQLLLALDYVEHTANFCVAGPLLAAPEGHGAHC